MAGPRGGFAALFCPGVGAAYLLWACVLIGKTAPPLVYTLQGSLQGSDGVLCVLYNRWERARVFRLRNFIQNVWVFLDGVSLASPESPGHE